MKLFTKESLISELKQIGQSGWVANKRHGNVGGVGNTLEDLLGIEENNLPLPNANEWEIKSQRTNTSSLTTLFHMEPSPRAMCFVPSVYLKYFGWAHKQAGKKYGPDEKSFRQTMNAKSFTDRGFIVDVDRINAKIHVRFDKNNVSQKHAGWLAQIISEHEATLSTLPVPYWGFHDLQYKAGSKLLNCFYIQADVKRVNGNEFYLYSKLSILEKFNFNEFITQIENGNILLDIDARTGHNHGTKFRLRQNCFQSLYEKYTEIDLKGV